MKWLLTSDWQAKFSTLDASKRAHEQELELISKYDIKGHIDLGDLKDAFNPVEVEVVKFQQDRKEAIHNAVVHDITLMGNHDMLAQTAERKNWFSLFDSVSGHNIQSPQVLQLGNCAFSCLPFMRSSKEMIVAAKQLYKEQKRLSDTTRRILLFHCDVHGAVWNNLNSRQSESKITLEKLHTSSYDMCFGGHIHKFQHLSENTIYVGNPYGTDAGEIDQQKGFVIYDDTENMVRRIRSVVPGLFSWRYVRDRKPALVAGSKIKAVVTCKVGEAYHKKLDKVSSTIEHKYPECISVVIPRFEVAQTDETVDIDPDATDYDKIVQYIKATVPDDLRKRRKEIITYLASTIGNATKTGVRQVGKIIFDEVEAQNVLTFERVKFSFRNRGIVLVKGENEDAQWNSNGAGKTNLLSLLPIGTSGRTFKDQQSDAWARDDNKDKAIVRLNMLDERNRQLSIIRQRRPVKLKFLINGVDESTGRRHTGKRETQGRIEETIGYTFDTLSNSVYIDSSLSNAFLTGTNADRAKLIHQFQNFDRFKIAKDIIGKEISALSKLEVEADAQKDVAEELLEQLIQDIAIAIKRKDDNLNELREGVKEARANYRTLNTSWKQLKQTHKVMLAKSEKKSKGIRVSINKISEIENVAKASLETKQEELESFASLGKLKKCPQCTQDLTEEHKQLVLKRLKKAISAKKTELKKATRSLKALSHELTLIEGPSNNLGLELDKLQEQTSVAHLTKELAKTALVKGKKKANAEKSDVKALTQRKHKLLSSISRTKRILKNYKDEFVFLKYAQETMSRDGLPLFLNKLLCPLLNKAAERYSEIFIDKEIQVLFDIDDGHIVPRIMNTHGGKSIASQSAGEKAWAGIITAFALREIANPTNLLVLDEPGTGLDTESAKMFGRRLRRLKDRFETILIVSHNDSICSALQGDNTVTVVKKNNVSKLK